MVKEICDSKKCTGCAACRDICPKQCISMCFDSLDALHPFIDETKCINCGLCFKTCPNNVELLYNRPEKIWAAWSKNEDIRRTSASGGIACELYHYWIENGGVAAGVVFERESGCHFVLIEKLQDIPATQNSKYTFSDTNGIYKIVKQKLQENIPVLFIGVPCQVAGLYCVLQNTDVGARLLDKMSSRLIMFERPMEEAFEVEWQLKAPSVKHKFRTVFEEYYSKTHNFEISANAALKKEKLIAIKTSFILMIRHFVHDILTFFYIR